MNQRRLLTREQALRLASTKFWEDLEPEQVARFQLNEELLCMPFSVYHEAMEKLLGRPVWTHEFAHPESLRAELRGDREPPTFEEIVALIPEAKRFIARFDEPENDEC